METDRLAPSKKPKGQVRRGPLPQTPADTSATEPVEFIEKQSSLDFLRRLEQKTCHLADPDNGGSGLQAGNESAVSSVVDRLNGVIGCKTSEVALAILAQIVRFENPTRATSKDQIASMMANATAMLGELQPTTATEAFLAAQMVGTQRTAMRFLALAVAEGQTDVGADANVLRATRLMRLFNEQVDTMAKLKGKGGQQRVVVEHVTVAAGGQAIVGTVIPGGGGGPSGDNRR